MSNSVHKKVDSFLRGHLFQVKTEGKDNASTAVHAPEKHANLILRCLSEVQIPEQQFPVKCAAFGPKRRTKNAAIRFVSSRHETLEVMTRDQLVVHGRT